MLAFPRLFLLMSCTLIHVQCASEFTDSNLYKNVMPLMSVPRQLDILRRLPTTTLTHPASIRTTNTPTASPSINPTISPITSQPTLKPTRHLTTHHPTLSPTNRPTPKPTPSPTHNDDELLAQFEQREILRRRGTGGINLVWLNISINNVLDFELDLIRQQTDAFFILQHTYFFRDHISEIPQPRSFPLPRINSFWTDIDLTFDIWRVFAQKIHSFDLPANNISGSFIEYIWFSRAVERLQSHPWLFRVIKQYLTDREHAHNNMQRILWETIETAYYETTRTDSKQIELPRGLLSDESVISLMIDVWLIVMRELLEEKLQELSVMLDGMQLVQSIVDVHGIKHELLQRKQREFPVKINLVQYVLKRAFVEQQEVSVAMRRAQESFDEVCSYMTAFKEIMNMVRLICDVKFKHNLRDQQIFVLNFHSPEVRDVLETFLKGLQLDGITRNYIVSETKNANISNVSFEVWISADEHGIGGEMDNVAHIVTNTKHDKLKRSTKRKTMHRKK